MLCVLYHTMQGRAHVLRVTPSHILCAGCSLAPPELGLSVHGLPVGKRILRLLRNFSTSPENPPLVVYSVHGLMQNKGIL